MKIKLLLLSVFIFVFSFAAFSQSSSLAVTSNKVTYTRKGDSISDYKRKFTVNYPKFSNINNPAVKRNLENTLNYWKIFDMSLEENLGSYTWLDSLDYKVNYNKNSLLDIELIIEGSGAYPSGTVKTFVVNLKTGKRIYINNAFTNIGLLIVKIEKAQQKELKNHIAQIKRDTPEDYRAAQDMFRNKRYSMNKLDEYSISDKGVTFLHDYGFPHAIKALQPDGRYFFTWAEMKPFIKRGGLFSKFIK